MRVIKFRGWDGDRMFFPGDGYTDTIEFGFDASTGKPYKIGIGEGDYDSILGYTWYDFSTEPNPELYPVTLMQFTGLVDKDGVEIYEGDIVEFLANSILRVWGGEPLNTYRRPVVWNDQKYCWWVGSIENGFQPDKETDDSKFLIVGNIYQNVHTITPINNQP